MNPEEYKKRIAMNFKRLREDMGWKQGQAAERGETTQNYISQIETAQIGLGSRATRKWAGIFNVDISEFYKPLEGSKSGVYRWASDAGLNEAETYMVELFRSLPSEAQNELLSSLEILTDRDTENRKSVIMKIREALGKAS